MSVYEWEAQLERLKAELVVAKRLIGKLLDGGGACEDFDVQEAALIQDVVEGTASLAEMLRKERRSADA